MPGACPAELWTLARPGPIPLSMAAKLLSFVFPSALFLTLANPWAQEVQAPVQLPATNQSQLQSAPVTAVVDLDKVYAAYPKTRMRVEKTSKHVQELKKSLDAEEQAMLQSQETLETFEPGSKDYRDFALGLRKTQAGLMETAKAYEAERDNMRQRDQLASLEEIQRGIAEFAKAKKPAIQLVLRIRSLDSASPMGLRLRDKMEQDLLYSAPELDITDAVIEYLKAE